MATTILCPTRGGQSSYPNQDRAIELAKERDADLIFLYVSDVQFLDHTAAPKVVDIETVLDEMGDFLLTMAIERANKGGIHATGIVKRGSFRQVLIEVIRTHSIGIVVIGKSRMDTSSLPPEYFKKLAEEIKHETGVEIVMTQESESDKSLTD